MKVTFLVIIGIVLSSVVSLDTPLLPSSANCSISIDSSHLYACPRCRKAKPKGPKKKPAHGNQKESIFC